MTGTGIEPATSKTKYADSTTEPPLLDLESNRQLETKKTIRSVAGLNESVAEWLRL